jgi:hypothetical protein
MVLVGMFITFLQGFDFGVSTWDICQFLHKTLDWLPFTPPLVALSSPSKVFIRVPRMFKFVDFLGFLRNFGWFRVV